MRVGLVMIAIVAAAIIGHSTANAAAVIDEGGYYNVHAYGVWVWEHEEYGKIQREHCCAATITDDTVITDDLIGPITVVAEDVQYPWTQGPYIEYFVFVDGIRWEKWYDPSSGASWWEAYPGPGIDPYCFGCG